jgi:hypothetical protein
MAETTLALNFEEIDIRTLPSGVVASIPDRDSRSSGSRLYCIGFSNGKLKVGKTYDLRQRAQTIASTHRTHGMTETIQKIWFTDPHSNAAENERIALDNLSKFRKHGEYFYCDEKIVIQMLSSLPINKSEQTETTKSGRFADILDVLDRCKRAERTNELISEKMAIVLECRNLWGAEAAWMLYDQMFAPPRQVDLWASVIEGPAQ